jgi:SAM-dependent methyltransferase
LIPDVHRLQAMYSAGRREQPRFMNDLPDFPPSAFFKEDPSPDALFYEEPRFVTHIDRGAIATVTELYRQLLPPGGAILDLMSSWVSHLPPDVAYGEVIGHGMNEEELAANKRLTRHFVQDLNADPILPIASASIDAAAICVSIQYLQQPVAVLRELARVLKSGAPVVITYSNRCFPTKAVAIWHALSDEQHAGLIALYLQRAGFAVVETRPPEQDLPRYKNPLYAVIGRTPAP